MPQFQTSDIRRQSSEKKGRAFGFTLISKASLRVGLPRLRRRSCEGFTLIELLVVISIIGILSSVALVAYSTAQKTARDGKRKSDVSSMATAVELYKQNNGSYPSSSCVSNATGTNFSALVDSKYINKVPTDPTCMGTPGTSGTCGCTSSGNDYYFGQDTNGRIYFLSTMESTSNYDTMTTCGSLVGVSINNSAFKYCFAP